MQVNDYIRVVNVDVPDSVLGLCKSLEQNMSKAVTGNGISDYRDCYEHYLHPQAYELFTKEEKELFDFLSSFLKSTVEQYIKDFNIDESSVVNMHSGFHILKYQDNGKYKEHVDDFGVNAFRRLSISLQLNDDFVGGEFSFFADQYRVKLKKNQALIFPSTWMYPHQVLPVTSGTRWAVVSWVI